MAAPWAVSPRLRVRRSDSASSTASSSAPTVRATLSPAPDLPLRTDSPDWGNARDGPPESVVPSHLAGDDAGSSIAHAGIIPDDSYGTRLADLLEDGSDEEAREQWSGGVHEALDEELDLDKQHDVGELQAGRDDLQSDRTPSTPSVRSLPRRQPTESASPLPSPARRAPYLPPNVSRLRSHTRHPSTSSINTTHSNASNGAPVSSAFLSPTAKRLRPKSVHSHLSALSRSSSSNLLAETESASSLAPGSLAEERPLGPGFAFHTLRRASALLSTQDERGRASGIGGLGEATVMAVNGMIVLGTTGGFAVVVGFDQTLRCVCGAEGIVKDAGAVTALAISPDQTYIAIGHAHGTIYLYDLAQPLKPVRTAPALPPHAVRSGRKEGHVVGSRILHVDFVGKRHTAIISGDEYGRAFWWSLGKVMGVESNDVVRLLGSYEPVPGKGVGGGPSDRRRKTPTLIAATPLPLGSTSHGTDTFTLTALMTQSKLVIVGLKPSPRTWFRRARPADEVHKGRLGGAVWLASGGTSRNALKGAASAGNNQDPVVAYSWGRTIRLLRVQVVPSEGPVDPAAKAPPNRVEFIEGKSWSADSRIHWLDWFGSDGRHLLVVTDDAMHLLHTPTMTNVEESPMDALGDRSEAALPLAAPSQHGLYKGKIFLLHRHGIALGSLLLWSDRILDLCHSGNFLAAIRLAVCYYADETPGSDIGLPEEPFARSALLARRVVDLVQSSINYAFSDDRALDGTYDTPDKRGVDLTSLFEDLASTCIYALRAIQRNDLIYDDVYERFLDNGIDGIFLDSLQDALLVDRVAGIPPHVIKALIARHEAQGDLEAVERIIWHAEPASLDIDQVIRLCQQHGLWDALIYIFNRCLKDYVSPLVKLCELVAKIIENEGSTSPRSDDTSGIAYKVFGYLEHLLTGKTYPDEQTMDPSDKEAACRDLYGALLRTDTNASGRPAHDLEPSPHRTLQLLLALDAEATLHVLDLAFEDDFLNGLATGQLPSRQALVDALVEMAREHYLHPMDRTFVHIFVARNLPKYPQFLHLPPDTLRRLLLNLTEHGDPGTREDRQLAVESLLSAYTPHDINDLYGLFRRAGFFALLQDAYRADQRWSDLIQCLVDDPDTGVEIFSEIAGIVEQGSVDGFVQATLRQSLPALLALDVPQTATLVQHCVPELHEDCLEVLQSNPHREVVYLRTLLGDENLKGRPDQVPADLRRRYLQILMETEPTSVLQYLELRGPGFFDLHQVEQACAAGRFPPGHMWALDKQNRLEDAFEVLTHSLEDSTLHLLKATDDPEHVLDSLDRLVHQAIAICQAREADPSENGELSLDELWYRLLRDSLASLQTVATSLPNEDASCSASIQRRLQATLQETLGSMMNATSQRGHAFPRLFKRLVDDSIQGSSPQSRRLYSQFRIILTGMLGSYASEEDILAVTNRLVSADLFDCIERYHKAMQAGWRPSEGSCSDCGVAFHVDGQDLQEPQIQIFESGQGKHVDCASESVVAV